MSKSYKELNALPAEKFLDWEFFKTNYEIENSKEAVEKAYAKAYDMLKDAKAFYIGETSVWSADLKSGGFLSSYEGIGYHALSCYVLKAALDLNLTIQVHRLNKPRKTIFQGVK